MPNITLRLIFVNYDGKPVEISVPSNWSYKELKKHILSDSWPSNYIEPDQVDRLRLFSTGKELEDSKAVSAGFASVHVTVVNKSAKGTAGEASSSNREERFKGCQCTIM